MVKGEGSEMSSANQEDKVTSSGKQRSRTTFSAKQRGKVTSKAKLKGRVTFNVESEQGKGAGDHPPQQDHTQQSEETEAM